MLLTPSVFAAKRIYIAPDDHTDYMWSADNYTYDQAFVTMLDYYLNEMDTTANLSPQYQAKWNPDGMYWVYVYEREKPAAEFDRLINRIKDEHISVPINTLVSVYGSQPTEAVLRGMYYTGRVERRYNLTNLDLANAMEDQTMSYGLGSLFAGSGAKYMWKGVCGCDTLFTTTQTANRENEIYYWVGADGSTLLTKWNAMHTGSNQHIGGYAEAFDTPGVVEYVDTNALFISKWPYLVIGAFGKGWDNLQTLTPEFVSVAQSKTNANRQVIVSNQLDFFRDFEQNYGNVTPSQSLAFGNDWELYSAAYAEQGGRVKRSVEQLRGAEALATLVSLKNSSFMSTRTAARDNAFMALGMYWEHNLGNIGGNVNRPTRVAWTKDLVTRIVNYVTTLQSDATTALGGMIQKSGTNQRFYVFNQLSWVRSDVADVAYSGSSNVHVVDLSTGQDVPFQIVNVDGVSKMRIFASNIPSVGYKAYEIQPGTGTNFSGSVNASGNVIENQYYRITVGNNGAITSLIDKQRGNREFIKVINGRAANDLGSSSGTVTLENVGPVSATLVITAPLPVAHVTRITLFSSSDRISIRNNITQNFNSNQMWRFGFNFTNPDVHHEEVGAVIRAKLSTQGGAYSPQNARYDWLTLNHFADMSDGNIGITLSNHDLEYMQLGASTPSTLDVTTPQITVLAGGRIPVGGGIDSQAGDSQFLQRFGLRTHDAFDPVAAMRFALEDQNTLIAGIITGGTQYPETNFSLLTISDPEVLLWALKPAEEGISSGVIMRTWNLGSSPKTLTVEFSDPRFTHAQQTTHLETNIQPVSYNNNILSASINQKQLKTFRVYVPDEQAPTVQLLAPAQGATINGTVQVQVTASDNQEVVRVDLRLDGQPLVSMTGPYTYQWNTATATNGQHTITAVAIDGSGNTATSSVDVVVNNVVISVMACGQPCVGCTNRILATACSLSTSCDGTNIIQNIKLSPGGTVVAGTSLTATIDYSCYRVNDDNVALWYYNGTGWRLIQGWAVLSGCDTLPDGIDGSVTTNFIPDSNTGTHYVRAILTADGPSATANVCPTNLVWGDVDDFAFNVTSTPPIPDTTAPNVTLTGPANGAIVAGVVNLTALASDNIAVAGVRFRIDAELGTEDTTAPYGIAWNSSTVANGLHTITAIARDTSNNVQSVNISVIVSNDNTAPVISDVNSVVLGMTSAAVSWVTDEPSTTQVEYGITISYGSVSPLNASLQLDHAQQLSGLQSNTLYHYRVHSRDATGNLAVSNDFTFTTLNDSVAPSVQFTVPTNGQEVQGVINLSATASDNVGIARIEFLVDGVVLSQDTTSPYIVSWNTLLAGNGEHVLSARAWDASDNSATTDITVLVNNDLDAPTISNVNVDTLEATSATIVWDTSEPSSTQIEYGVTESYGSFTTLQSALVNAHSQQLSGLQMNTLYHYRVHSRDAVGNLAVSGDFTFTTPVVVDTTLPVVTITAPANGASVLNTITINASATDNIAVTGVQFFVDGIELGTDYTSPYSMSWNTSSVGNGVHVLSVVATDSSNNTNSAFVNVTVANDLSAPTLSGVSATSITQMSATITWTTNEPATRQVEYGLTPSYGSQTTLNSTLATNHVQQLTGLQANTTYYYRVKSRDAAGNLATGADLTFTTQAASTIVPGLVASYSFNEASGTTIVDASGRGNNGTISGATRNAAGKSGAGIDFDGINDFITVNDAPSLDLTTGMTLEAWVRPTVSTAWRTVILKERPGQLTYALYSSTDTNRPSGHVFIGGDREVRGSSQLPVNTWTHLATTYNGSAIVIYVNGVVAGTAARTGLISTSNNPLRIGGNAVWNEYYQGRIDEVRVYNRSLTQAEIQADMNTPI